MKIGLLSDTHGYLDPEIFNYFKEVEEIWHAGDIGGVELLRSLENFKPTIAVYGNIDDHNLRLQVPESQILHREGLDIWITHIGGYPPRYTSAIRHELDRIKPHLFICGHSHILKIIPDGERKPLLHINPGAAGKQGLHQYRTIVRFDIESGRVENPEVIRLGLRGAIE